MKNFLLLLMIPLFLATGCAGKSARDIAIQDALEELETKNYQQAYDYLLEADESASKEDIAFETPEQKGEIMFFKARALYGLERFEEADYISNKIIQKFPESPFAAQVKVLKKHWHEKFDYTDDAQ